MPANNELIEYLTSVVPGARIECAGCGVVREASVAVIREEKFYCKAECADRANAVLKKQQPAGVKAGGYMDV